MGPCAKAAVRCTIIRIDGQRFVGENICQNPQDACPRLPGEDYAKCKSICRQIGHAEEVAAYLAKGFGYGGIAYLEGHTYACDACKEALTKIGVRTVVIGPPYAV